MDGGQNAFFNPELIEEHLSHRSQPISGAGSVRDYVVSGRIIHFLVDTQDDGQIFLLARCGDDYFFGSSIEVKLRLVSLPEHAGGFDDNLNPQLAPRQARWIPFGKNLHLVSVGHKAVFARHNFTREPTVVGVVLQQMRHDLDSADIINSDDIDFIVVAFADTPVNLAANSPKAIYPNSNRHKISCLQGWNEERLRNKRK